MFRISNSDYIEQNDADSQLWSETIAKDLKKLQPR